MRKYWDSLQDLGVTASAFCWLLCLDGAKELSIGGHKNSHEVSLCCLIQKFFMLCKAPAGASVGTKGENQGIKVWSSQSSYQNGSVIKLLF